MSSPTPDFARTPRYTTSTDMTVARRVVELLREEGAVSRQGPRLLTVAAVAQEFGVSTDWG